MKKLLNRYITKNSKQVTVLGLIVNVVVWSEEEKQKECNFCIAKKKKGYNCQKNIILRSGRVIKLNDICEELMEKQEFYYSILSIDEETTS